MTQPLLSDEEMALRWHRKVAHDVSDWQRGTPEENWGVAGQIVRMMPGWPYKYEWLTRHSDFVYYFMRWRENVQVLAFNMHTGDPVRDWLLAEKQFPLNIRVENPEENYIRNRKPAA